MSSEIRTVPGYYWVVKDQDLLGGQPAVRGTRLSVSHILACLSEGMTAQEIARDYPKWLADNAAPFFVPDTPQIVRSWIMQMMLSVPLPVAMACRKTISFADLRTEAAKIDIPTLIVQGDKDASAPLKISGAKTARLIKGSELRVYEDAPHGLPLTHGERLLADLLAFHEA